ncbi:MAG: winged helix-turn-helix transcriptional regulator [Candidatus Micrarchaeia archaeon]
MRSVVVEPVYVFHSRFNDEYSVEARKILRQISENARVSISELSKATGVSRATVAKKLRQLESKLGIRYTFEPDEQKLGISSTHLIAVKLDEKPSDDELLKIFGASYIPQGVVVTKGDYDLLVYAMSLNNMEYAHWDKSMQIELAKYGVTWQSSWVVHRQLGFFPVRNELIDKLQIKQRDKEMLKLLNENSRMSFQEMSRRLGMHFNTVAYSFNKLLKSGYVKRLTITMPPQRLFVLMSFFTKYQPRDGYEAASAQARKAFMSDDRDSLVSRYLISAPLIGTYDFFTLGAFDDYKTALRRDIAYHKSLFKKHNIKMKHATAERVLIGSLPIRSIDTAKEYNTIVWSVPQGA